MPDRRHEDRPARQPAIKLRLRQVLVLELQRIEFEGRAAVVLVRLDHRPAAAGVAADRVDGDRVVGRDDAGIDQRTDQADRAGGIAAGIGHLARARRCARPGPAPSPESHRPSPGAPGAQCWRPAASAPRCPARRPAPPTSRAASSGRHRIPDRPPPSCRGAPPGPCGGRPAMLLSATSGSPRRRSRMPSPVVPASPSMNTLGLVGHCRSSGLRHRHGRPRDRPSTTCGSREQPGWPGRARPRLALAELEASSRLRLAVLLALDHARSRGSGSRRPSGCRAGPARSRSARGEMPCRTAPAWPDRPPPVTVQNTSNWL